MAFFLPTRSRVYTLRPPLGSYLNDKAFFLPSLGGGIGRRTGLKILRGESPVPVRFRP